MGDVHPSPPNRTARLLLGLPLTGIPDRPLAARALLATHVARKALRELHQRPSEITDTARNALAGAILMEITCRHFGSASMLRGRHGLFPHIFMPRFDGPHFDEALRRFALPGQGPNVLYFSLTGACPCTCDYCYAGASAGEVQDIGDQAVLEVARQVARLRVPVVNISGGEPLTRYSRLKKAVRVLSAGSEVRMFTTGLGLDDRRLAELEEAGLTGIFVSLDGADAAAFDRVRGFEGAFEAATSALRRSARAGMLTYVNCVVGRQRFRNRARIADFLRFVEGIHPGVAVNFIPQLATGRGVQVDSFSRPEECHEVAERIVETGRELGRPVALLFGTIDTFLGCAGAGGKLLNVDIAGNVTVCISKAALGNLLDEPFEDIYARYVESCDRLKVGFFCADVAQRTGERILVSEDSHEELAGFYARSPDSTWQKTLDRYGGLFATIVPA